MKAYAILDGGGVKGAALAGCLYAAEQRQIEFIGYGGTSAGSIVALLACVGYNGDELRNIMLEEIKFTDFLDDKGKKLERIKQVAINIQFAPLWKKILTILCNLNLLNQISDDLGLYHGNELENFLLDKIKQKLNLPSHIDSISFNDLKKRGLPSLKIVASDLKHRRAIVYSAEGGDEQNGSVLDAVRASISYPFVFRPVERNRRYLVDGGLSSNLPVFLFERERRAKRLPIIAFDLVAKSRPKTDNYGIKHYCSDILATALDSGNKLLQDMLSGIHHVVVETPQYIGTLDFSISKEKCIELFEVGNHATFQYFNSYIPQWEQAEDKVKRLQALYGPPDLISIVLESLVKSVENDSQAKNVRANIMLPTENDTSIVVYHYNMDTDPDIDLELQLGAGCAGKAWTTGKPTFVNLGEDTSPEEWGMTQSQQNKIRSDRRTIISVPVFDIPRASLHRLDTNNTTLISTDLTGILSIDTSTDYCDIMEDQDKRKTIIQALIQWSDVLSRILN